MSTNSQPARVNELNMVKETLNPSLLGEAQTTLKQCARSSTSTEEIEQTLPLLDFELLERALDNITEALTFVHDPILQDKNRFIDSLQVTRENLALLVTPFFEEYAPEDALTEKQAKRFVVNTYTPNKLVRQAGAAHTAARELNNISTNLENTSVTTSSTTSTQSLAPRIKTTLRTFFAKFRYTPTDNTESTKNNN